MSHAGVCAVVLNWNGWRDTLECLNSLMAAEPGPETVIVVDNSSTDGSVERIWAWGKEHFGSIIVLDKENVNKTVESGTPTPFVLICNDENPGYAGGNNLAISWALERGVYNLVWILNNDTVVLPNTLSKLLECARQSTADIFGATVVYADREDVVQCAGGCRYYPLTTIFRPVLSGMPLAQVLAYPKKPRIDYIYGASLLVRSEVFTRCGLLNEDYFLFYEEIDICRRAVASGYTLHWCKQAIVHHKVSSSVGKKLSGDKEKISIANYHETLSTLIFTKRFHRWAFPFAVLFRFFGKIAVLVWRGEWYLLKPLIAAYRDYFTAKYGKGRT